MPAVLVVSLGTTARAQTFNQVIVFGDSNVDSGFYKALSSPGGGTTFNSLWPSAVAHGAGAPTTNPGLNNSQVLAAHFGLTADPSNQPGGTNYASSGAKNVTVNNSQTGGFQAAVPTVTQISNYLSANSGAANPQALYLINSGANDVSYALGDTGAGPYPSDPDNYLRTTATDLANAIATLQSKGAQTIIVAGLPYSFPVNNAASRAAKLLYTNALWDTLASLNVSFIRGDIDVVRRDIVANPSKYGFQFVGAGSGQTGCVQPSGVNSAWSLLCSSDPAAPSTYASADAPYTRLFADDSHLGTAGQKLIGDYYYRLLVPAAAAKAPHDFDGDSFSDILWRRSDGNLAIWLMNGLAPKATSALGVVDPSWQIAGTGDFDGDGKADALWRRSDGNLAIWLMNGFTLVNSATFGMIDTAWQVVGTGDFDADGKADIVWRRGDGNLAVWLMNGLSIKSTNTFGAVDTSWQVSGVGDVDGDGSADLVWRRSDGNFAVWLMNGLSIKATTALGAVETSWQVANTGDFDGDGKADVLWRRSDGNVAVWLMNGAALKSSAAFGTTDLSWQISGTGDFNADGKGDILWRNTTGTVGIWLMNGLTVATAQGVASVTTDWVIQK